MIQRILLIMGCLAFGTLGFAQDVNEFWACPQGLEGQELRVYNWTTYIAEDTISNFEALCDVTVTYDTFLADDELLATLQDGNPRAYDLAMPIDSTMYLLLAENLLQELDYARIPNAAKIGQGFKDRANTFDPDNRHSIPYLWGTTGIGYNRTLLGEINGMADVFAANARVAWIDYDRLMLGLALNMLGLDPSSANPADLAQARDYLVQNSGNLTVIADDTGQDLLAAGEVDIVIEYSGDVFQIINQCRVTGSCNGEMAYTVPIEGTVTDMTSLVIPNGAQNPQLAHVFIDYLLDPQVAADIANYTVYGSPNQVAIDEGLIYEDYLTDPAIYPPAERLERLFILVANDEIAALYEQTWEEVKALTGK